METKMEIVIYEVWMEMVTEMEIKEVKMATEMEMEIKAVWMETAIEMETIDLTLLVHTDPCMLELYKNLIDLNPLSSSPLFICNVNSIQ